MMLLDFHAHTPSRTAVCSLDLRAALPAGFSPDTPFSVGLHPLFLEDVSAQCARFEALCTHPLALAVGECGLDRRSPFSLDEQTRALEFSLCLAERHRLPVVVHLVGHTAYFLDIVAHHPGLTFCLHGYAGSFRRLQPFLERGFYVSLGMRFYADSARCLAARLLPPDRLFFETDADAAHPVDEVCALHARYSDMSPTALSAQILCNFRRFFHTRPFPSLGGNPSI